MITIGEYDEPENQKQGILNLDLIKTGNTIVYGSADSGKETLLSTMIYDLMTTYTTDEVWMYIIDFGTESFKIFKECPHVGEVIFANEGEKLSRFFTRINEITKERKKILSEYNGDYGFFLRTSGKTMPLITIFINGYESFAENYGAIFEDLLLVLTREGQKLGITFVISTASSNDMRYRMKQNFKQKLALSLNDSGDYSIIFDGIGNRVPAHRFGRGFANVREKVLEFQTAKVCEPEEYNVFIKDEIEKVKKRNENTAERIEILPEVVKTEDFKVENMDITNMPIGLTRKDIKPEFYNFKENFITIITSKNIEESMQFSSNIWREMDEIKDVNTIILDPDRKVLSGRNDLKNNFEQLLANLKKKTTKYNICFILGLDKFINYLEDEANRNGDDSEGGEVLESVIKKCETQKNVSFIIVDTAVKIKEHKYDDWYSEFVLDDNVIWIGNGIDDQYILEVNAPRREVSNNCGCSFGYFNKKDKTVMLKLLGMKEKREEEDE